MIFAGSIGIIGIALILSLSNGIQDYIDRVQQETLSSYPINLVDESFDLGSILETIQPAKDNLKKHKLDKIYSRNMMTKIMEAMVTEKKSNNLSEFKKFLDSTKKDVSRVFNAETLIIGFVAGAIGIGVTLLLNVPANIIIKNLTDIDNIAKLPTRCGIILVIISKV